MESVTLQPARVAPFFVINAGYRPKRLEAMVQEFADAGYDGVILHPRAGLRIPYLSESWFEAIRLCVQSAAAHGMKSWLYDEYPYPSGVAGGRVLARNPNFAELHLDVRRFPVEGGGRVTCPLGEGRLLAAFLVPTGQEGEAQWEAAQEVTADTGVYNSTWIDRAHDSRYYYSTDHARLYRCRRAMEYLPVRVFERDIATGSWELIAFFQVTGGDSLEPFGHYVDVSNRAATEAFLEETHEAYRARMSQHFGAEIEGIFTDEPKYRNPLPWSNAIAAEWGAWQENRSALLSLLPDGPKEAIRRSFRETTHQLFAQSWIAPIRDWCDRNTMQLVGHISPEEDWWAESRCAGSILPLIRQFHTPGCDLIIPAVGDREHPILNSTPIMAVSAAAQSGAPYALCEMLACSDYSISMQTIKRIGDWLASFGINFAVPHGCFQSLEGLRRYDAPPTFIAPNTNHRFMDQWVAEFRATASRLGPQNVVVETAVVRPMRNLFGITDEAEGKALARSIHTLGLHLLEQGIAYHWIDDRDLVEATILGGEIAIGHARYRRLIVPLPLADPASAAGLERAESAGVELLDLQQAHALIGPLQAEGGEVRAVETRQGDTFCLNLSSERRTFLLRGELHELDGYESRWIEPSDTPWRSEFKAELAPEQWTLRPESANSLRLLNWSCNDEPCEPGPLYRLFPQLGHPLSEETVYGPIPAQPLLNEPVLLTYRTAFNWEGAKPLFLIIESESIHGDWTLWLNGEALAEWHDEGETEAIPRRRYPIAPCTGRNEIEIRLTARDRRDGMLVVPYLEGEFIVASTAPPHLAPLPNRVQGAEWSANGFPHYSGAMLIETTLDLEESESLWLEFDTPPAAMVEVEFNGIPLGSLLWSPWRLNLSPAARLGRNELSLRVTNTLYNQLYGRALPSGLPGGARITRRLTAAPRPAPALVSSTRGMTLVETALALGLMAFCAVSLMGLLPVMLTSMSASRERMLASRLHQKVAIALREAPPTTTGTLHFTLEGASVPAGATGDIVVTHTAPQPLLLPDASDGYSPDQVQSVSITIENGITGKRLLQRSIYLAP